MKKIFFVFILLSFKASCIFDFEVYIREAKSFDGKSETLSFATGFELNQKLKTESYDSTQLYAFHYLNDKLECYKILTNNNCGEEVYKQCINEMVSMIEAQKDSTNYKIIVYK